MFNTNKLNMGLQCKLCMIQTFRYIYVKSYTHSEIEFVYIAKLYNHYTSVFTLNLHHTSYVFTFRFIATNTKFQWKKNGNQRAKCTFPNIQIQLCKMQTYINKFCVYIYDLIAQSIHICFHVEVYRN